MEAELGGFRSHNRSGLVSHPVPCPHRRGLSKFFIHMLEALIDIVVDEREGIESSEADSVKLRPHAKLHRKRILG